MKHLLNINSLSSYCIKNILNDNFSNKNFHNKIAALVFFEPSTRTLLSFQTAIYKLDMKPLILNINNSSQKKGESDIDTIKTIMQYVDIIIIRHSSYNFIHDCCKISTVPIINAGSGDFSHPSQALADLYTILQYHTPAFKIGFVGDLKSSRTIKSLIELLNKMLGKDNLIKYYFVPDGNLVIDNNILNKLNNNYYSFNKIDDIIMDVDILYMTRIQQERKNSKTAKLTLKLTTELLDKSKDEMILMHPLPRLKEIPIEIDNDKKAIYFETVKNAVHIRMSIIKYCLNQ